MNTDPLLAKIDSELKHSHARVARLEATRSAYLNAAKGVPVHSNGIARSRSLTKTVLESVRKMPGSTNAQLRRAMSSAGYSNRMDAVSVSKALQRLMHAKLVMKAGKRPFLTYSAKK